MNLSTYSYISAENTDSFARFTIEKRLPSILDNIIASGLFEEKINEELIKLRQKLPNLQVQSLKLEKEELSYWESFYESYSQKAILEIPFFFAEIYFYRYLLEITQFSENRIDPFSLTKADELSPNTNVLEELLKSVDSIEKAITFSLSGNKADLSQLNRNDSDLSVIVDHTTALVKQIEQQDIVHIILDNAGVELFSDFLLVKQILQKYPAKKMKLYPKKLPLLVSDATLADINLLFDFLKNSKNDEMNELEKYLNAQIKKGNIEIILHSFWNSPNHFTHLPTEIKSKINRDDVVIAKGDANYRRFYEDRMIPPKFQGAAVISANQFALRTLKSEIIAGIDADLAKELNERDPQWRVNGQYALIQRLV